MPNFNVNRRPPHGQHHTTHHITVGIKLSNLSIVEPSGYWYITVSGSMY